MATALATPKVSSHDPLDYLPRVPIMTFKKGQCIYGQSAADCLYLVNDGFVKISNIGPEGREVLIDIYRAEEFFGELSFHPSTAASTECAFALSEVHVMCWPIEDIYALMLSRPQLALAFLKIQAARNMTSVARIESTATMDLKDRWLTFPCAHPLRVLELRPAPTVCRALSRPPKHRNLRLEGHE